MLQIRSLTKSFGSVTAVDDISFTIGHPQMVGIIGRSGAGKSTLLRMTNRLTDATAGQITYKDRDVLTLKGADVRAWQANCAMIFQQFNL
ncbi:MAG: ATP-binding cassette domain-containing protein, partial [Pseudomonadota bacterium]